MRYLMGTKTSKAIVASNDWVATLISAEFASENIPYSRVRCPEMKLFLDFGGMISTAGTPRVHLDCEDGEFLFFAHQRRGVKRMIEQALKTAGPGEEYVRLESQYHTLCITTMHALEILYHLDSEDILAMEKDALACCSDMLEAIRKLPGVELSPEHNLALN
ncbi:MAG TPA: hypothetical protein VMW90_05185 [Acidobacteriota bacterium]|nr:hypothetical protein [Acidobacteriota bacterium]